MKDITIKSLNIGLPILECEDVVEKSDAGDMLEVELSKGKITNVTKGLTFNSKFLEKKGKKGRVVVLDAFFQGG
jgi:3-isopropylmalate dehydratase small subunit